MTLDITQADQMLKWLDEERRRDKALLAALQERVTAQGQQMARQEEQLAALQGAVAGIEAVLSRATEFAQAVDQFKADVSGMLDKRDEQRRKEEREAARARQLEIGALKDEVARLDEEVQHIHAEERAATLQAEQRRLNEVVQRLEGQVTELGKRSEDRTQAVTYLEEQRRADNRRIASLEAETTGLRKRAEGADGKLLLLEETIQKERARIDQGLAQIKEFDKAFEEVRVADFRRTQQFKKWTDQAEEIRQALEQLRAERQRFLEQYQQAKGQLERLDTFRAQMETRQNEVAEMQRLAEDRLKRQWEEWQAAAQKEHRGWELESEEQRKKQERTNKDHDGRLKAMEDRGLAHQQQIQSLWESLAAQDHALVAALQEQLERIQRAVQGAKELS